MIDPANKFAHKKSLGQHFLNSDYAPKKLCDAASLKPGELVLEIGPGTGALTKELLSRGVKVIALEADERALDSLKESFKEPLSSGQLVLHHHDVRELNLSDFGLAGKDYKVVSNIPYYLSGLLFRMMLTASNQPQTLVFLVQKEVGIRLARSKKESLLSLSAQVYGDPLYVCTIARGHFTPPPKVDSAIVAINNISKDRLKGVSEELFFTVLHLGFGQKRKQLLGNLASQYDRSFLERVFSELNLSQTVRAEDVPLQTWLTLVNKLVSPV